MDKAMWAGASLGVLIFLIYLGINPLPLLIIITVVGAVYLWSEGRVESKSPSDVPTRSGGKTSVPTVRFEEIGGQERAKTELKEALDFLKERDRISAYGIRPLKGILLTGPPGTGKTLMAKAAAHYTDSVFVSASGSEFVEMYVGVGARRIRQLFERARRLAKKSRKTGAVIFIDEIDAIGGKRQGSQHREYDQTLNQLLTEMDGITGQDDIRILVMAATNRMEMLDPALLRPGRFDRHITVDLPDKKARRHILELHTRNKPLSSDVDLDKVAGETFGFSGAQLESVTNEAAIYAMREGKEKIEPHHFSKAIDKVMLGEQTDRETTMEEKERVAVHELGHAIVAECVEPGSVAQVVLAPRGQALGYVRHFPGEDRFLYTKRELENRIKICLAGAAAEQLILGNRSTGAQNDYDQAIRLVRTMVETGLSDLGIIDPEWVNKEKVHDEISRILSRLFDETTDLLIPYEQLFREGLHPLLLEESLSGDDFRKLLTKYAPEPVKIDKVH